jgi:hypothetical protein
MHKAQPPQEEIDEWKERTQTNYDEMEDIPVPPFHLSKKAYAFGNGKLRVETTLLQVNCAVDDAKYLKTLLAETFTHIWSDQGQFIPAGLHLITDTATLKQKLSDNNDYLKEVKSIAVVGLPPAAYEIGAEFHLNRIINDSGLFLSVEETNFSRKLGKYFFITTEDKCEQAKTWINVHLTKWAQEFIPMAMKIPNIPLPRRTVLSATNSAIKTYASLLQQETISNEEDTKDYTRKAPSNHRKKRRQEISIIWDDKEYPALSKQQQPAAPASKLTQNSAETNNSANALANAEAKWNAELKATNESYDRRMSTMNKAMNEKLESQQKQMQSQIERSLEATNTLSSQVQTMQATLNGIKEFMKSMTEHIRTNTRQQQSGNQYYTQTESREQAPPIQEPHQQPNSAVPYAPYTGLQGRLTGANGNQSHYATPTRQAQGHMGPMQIHPMHTNYGAPLTYGHGTGYSQELQASFNIQQQPAGSPSKHMETTPTRVGH